MTQSRIALCLLCACLIGLPQLAFGQARFVPAGSLLGPRYQAAFAEMTDGRIFIAGGKVGTNAPTWASTSTEIYDPTTGTSMPGPNLAQGRFAACAARLSDGRIAIFGGERNNYATADKIELYDPVSNTIQLAGILPRRVGATALALKDGRVLIAGGRKNDLTYPIIPELWILTFTNDGVSYITVYEGYRDQPTLTQLNDGRVFIAGGYNNTYDPVYGRVQSAKIFEPTTNTLTSAGNMSTRRMSHAATLMADGRVFISGGKDDQNFSSNGTTPKCDIFDPATNTYSTYEMLTSRAGHWAALQPDGKIVINGQEVFNPANSTFTPTGAIVPIPRWDAQVFALADGRQLILGGLSPNVVTAVEIFQPDGWAIALPPQANAGSDQFVFAGTATSATVVLDGTGSTDPQASPLVYKWTGPGIEVMGATVSVTMEVGMHTLTLEVTNEGGKSSTDAVQIAVVPGGGDPDLVAQLQQQLAQLLAGLQECNDESTALLANLANLQSENAALKIERDALILERDTLKIERDAVIVERDALAIERDSLREERDTLKVENDSLKATNGSLSIEIATLTATNQSLQGEVNRLNSLTTQMEAELQSLVQALASAFNDPDFEIPGETLQDQLQNLVTAIDQLNHGQQQALYKKLGGKK